MNKKWQIALIGLIGIGIVAMIIFVGMKSSTKRKMASEQIAKTDVEGIDVDKYYNEKSTILDKYSVQDSPSIQTESEAREDITKRGFEQNPITYDYDIEGKYLGNQAVDDSTSTHPIYQTHYISSAGELWTIISINGTIIANPVSYNMESEMGVQTVLSESESIVGYDSKTNTFYDTIPNKSELIVKVVEKIDAALLDSLNKETVPELYAKLGGNDNE